MLQSLNHLTLAVSNLQTSLTFWRDLLGLQLHAEWDTGAYSIDDDYEYGYFTDNCPDADGKAATEDGGSLHHRSNGRG